MSNHPSGEKNESQAKQANGQPNPRVKPLVAIFITVLLDMLGFAMFIPDLQLRGEAISRATLGTGASEQAIGFLIGVTLAAFSVAQLLTAPLLGKISDQKGRRGVLLISSGLSVLSYLLYAFADSIPILLLARILSGIAASNLGVAFAYVADSTEPENRSKSLGMLGAAFGIGFIIGPALGAQLLSIGRDSPKLLGFTSAVFALLNLIFIYKFVPESLKPDATRVTPSFFAQFKIAFATPNLGLLLVMFFAVNLGFTNLETTFFRLLESKDWIFHFEKPKEQGAYVLILVGVVAALMQGIVVGKVNGKHGDLKVLRFAYLLFVPMIGLVPFVPLWYPGVLIILGLGISNGLASPSLTALISRSASATMQGGVFGITQALGALARATSPLISSPLFAYKPYAPYVFAAGIICVPALFAWTKLREKDFPLKSVHIATTPGAE